jgi:hypothetical protein
LKLRSTGCARRSKRHTEINQQKPPGYSDHLSKNAGYYRFQRSGVSPAAGLEIGYFNRKRNYGEGVHKMGNGLTKK